MVYARCLYCVVLWADPHQRVAHAITLGKLTAFLQHACLLLGCQLVSSGFGQGYAIALVDLNVNIAIESFISCLKSWTSAWIAGSEAPGVFWTQSCFSAVSPDDRLLTVSQIHSACTQGFPAPSLASASILPCHHIILLTSRYRLLIPVKYRYLLAEVAAETARSLNADVIASSAMRNHVHLLCRVPLEISIAQFIDELKSSIFEHSQANRHLRCIEGWSEHSVAYTVSASRIMQEEHDVLSQDDIHWRRRRFDEMSPLYQRLGIPYVASLH